MQLMCGQWVAEQIGIGERIPDRRAKGVEVPLRRPRFEHRLHGDRPSLLIGWDYGAIRCIDRIVVFRCRPIRYARDGAAVSRVAVTDLATPAGYAVRGSTAKPDGHRIAGGRVDDRVIVVGRIMNSVWMPGVAPALISRAALIV